MKEQYYKKMIIKLLGIDSWHKTDYKDKPYVLYTLAVIKKVIEDSLKTNFGGEMQIIEIGCGLGDIIGNVKCNNPKLGLDYSARMVNGAKLLHPLTRFKKGSFSSVRTNETVCLIMVNILHFLDPEYVNPEVKKVLRENEIKYVIMDEVRNTAGTEYKYEYDGTCLLGSDYKMKYRGRRLKAANGAYRHVVVYEKQ